MKKRKHILSQRFVVKTIADTPMLLAVFNDLSDQDLKEQFDYYLEREDFEYLEQIVGEAMLRGYKFRVKNGSH